MDIDLSTGAPASPERTLHLSETFAELVRAMAYATMHREAFAHPDEAARFLRDLERGAGGIPQLLDQVARWHCAEDDAGRIAVPSGQWAGRPATAVTALRVRLDAARATAAALGQDLEHAAQVTSDMAGVEGGTDG